jgi:hypothetical protein
MVLLAVFHGKVGRGMRQNDQAGVGQVHPFQGKGGSRFLPLQQADEAILIGFLRITDIHLRQMKLFALDHVCFLSFLLEFQARAVDVATI